MPVSAAKLLPSGVVLLVVGYFCWSFMSARPVLTENRGGTKRPEIAASLLSPAIQPASERNPFRPTMPTTIISETKDLEDDPQAEEATTSETDWDFALSGLTLKATFTGGNHRLALINGELYEQGESLHLASSPKAAVTVAQIYQHKVLLEGGGQAVELKYPGVESKSATLSPASAQTPKAVTAPTHRAPGHTPATATPRPNSKSGLGKPTLEKAG